MLLTISFLALPGNSCANFAGRVREYTYPPAFHYITDQQLRSTMWQLAYHSRELRVLVPMKQETVQRDQVLHHLQAMEQVMIELNRTGWPTNHPMIDANLSTFLRDIRSAGDAVSRDPPNFFLAGAISGACAYCHSNQ
ncbi:MAG TPA: hypothetical protein VF089_12595 [Candidatus Binatia bacterium]